MCFPQLTSRDVVSALVLLVSVLVLVLLLVLVLAVVAHL